MKKIPSGLKWLTIVACVVTAIIWLRKPIWEAIEWIAWNSVKVEFIATCKIFEHSLRPNESDILHFVWGHYSGEFIREVKVQWGGAYPDIPLELDGEGNVIVPIGFYLPVDPFWSRFGGLSQPEERGWEVSARAVDEIFGRRMEDGADMTPYMRYAERSYWDRGGPRRLHSSVCGFMEQLILRDGTLARE
jgi:hypothetical protein